MTVVQRFWRLGLVASVLLVALAAIGPALAANTTVEIVDKAFAPATITVAKGDTVTWTVTKSIGEPHTVTATATGGATPAFDSSKDDPDLAELKDDGGTFSFTFTEAGTFAYLCTIHADVMKGTITVSEAGPGEPTHPAEGIAPERKLLGAGILAGTLIVGFIAAWFYRRMNPA
jgi:plastocyanin